MHRLILDIIYAILEIYRLAYKNYGGLYLVENHVNLLKCKHNISKDLIK